jgi:peptidoglycan/xylan/chitin deacetylase (PgdA/CDA1 family)
VEGLTGLGSDDPRLLVLIYHRVLPAPDAMYPYDPDVGAFRRQMTALREDFRVARLADAVADLARGTLPARTVAITFDDGFADNVTCALPVLAELGLTATFFIASGYLDGSPMFNDLVIEACRRAPDGDWATGTALGTVHVPPSPAGRCALAYRMLGEIKYLEASQRLDTARRLLDAAGAVPPVGLMMDPAGLRRLRDAGMDIGAHTRSHPILARLDDAAAEREIRDGASDLADILGAPVEFFAYPNGRPGRDYGARDVAIVRRLAFRAAVSTAWGFADGRTDPHQVPRVGSWGRSAWQFSGRIALARRGSRGESARASVGG